MLFWGTLLTDSCPDKKLMWCVKLGLLWSLNETLYVEISSIRLWLTECFVMYENEVKVWCKHMLWSDIIVREYLLEKSGSMVLYLSWQLLVAQSLTKSHYVVFLLFKLHDNLEGKTQNVEWRHPSSSTSSIFQWRSHPFPRQKSAVPLENHVNVL